MSNLKPEFSIEPCTSAGITTLKSFIETKHSEDEKKLYKNYGLTDQDIKMYFLFKEDPELFTMKYKNVETSTLNTMISNICDKIEKGQTVNLDTKFSIDPQFQLSHKEKPKYVDPKHPMNSINSITKDLFGHLDDESMPTATKQRKLARRYERKLNQPFELPEPSMQSSNKDKAEKLHKYSGFIKSQYSDNIVPQSNSTNPNSKWDVKTVEKKTPPNIYIQKEPARQTVKTCKTEDHAKALYTIKDNKIVRLVQNDESNSISDIIVPINKAEERLLEGNKISINDIKKLPKFQNYTPGQPSKVLYIKNLSNAITQNDLEIIFQNYHCHVRLMTGKMKGQAFITFDDLMASEKVLAEFNGTILKGKPMIIQYGKKENE